MSDKPIRVVVVDDDEEAKALVVVRLKGHPRIEVIGTGASGREAIQLANTLRPDVMVLDVMMPILNGLEAAGRISSVFPSIGLLMLTSDASPESIRAALRAGAKDYLDKSTELFRLAEAVIATDNKRDRTMVDKGLAGVWAFYGAKGGAGSTTMAIAAAQELASAGQRVTVLDLDLLHGDCGFYLNIPPGQTNLIGAMAELKELDMAAVSPFIKRYNAPEGFSKTNFFVVDSPSDFVRFDDSMLEKLVGLMELLITSNDFVILDLPSGRIFEPQNIAVLDFVERLFFMTNRDMASLRSLLTFSRILARTTVRIARLTILCGELREQSTFDHKQWLVSTKLNVKSLMEIPFDAKTCAKAVTGGMPLQLADQDSPLSRFTRRVVEVGLRREPEEVPEEQNAEGGGKLWQAFKKLVGG